MKKSTKEKPRHTRKWFINRIGSDIIKNNDLSLINPPIKIADKNHAEALYISQSEKNITYSETIL